MNPLLENAPIPQLLLAGPVENDDRTGNYEAAKKDLSLSPQEQDLYLRHLNNLYGPGGVDHSNGARSTLYQMSTEHNGKTYNLPTVYDGNILSPDDAFDRAVQTGIDQFPAYPSGDAAEQRYQQMHDYMEKDTQRYMQGRELGVYPDYRRKPRGKSAR